MSFLSNLRAKPEGVKSRIAVISALMVTGVIGVVWTSTLPVRFASLESGIAVGVENSATAKNAITDLVAEMEQIPPPVEETETLDASTESFFMEESALDRLAGERFDPTEEGGAGGGVEEMGTETRVEETPLTTTPPAPETALPKTEEPTPKQEPRVILIGTTTAPATHRLPVTW